MTRLLVFGSRTWTDRVAVWNALGALPRSCIIEGEAKGADAMARQWAQFYRVPLARFPADWDRHGRAAGPMRNVQMLREGKPDRAIGFISGRVGEALSKGSADMAARVKAAGVALRIHRENGLEAST